MILLLTTLGLVAASCTGSGSSYSAPAAGGGRASGSPSPGVRVRHELRVRPAGHLQSGLQGVAATPDGSGVLVAGGLAAGDRSVATVQRITASSATLRGDLPVAVHDAAATVEGDNLIVFGGGNATTTDQITEIPTSGGHGKAIGHLPVPLSDLTAVPYGGATYLIGGYTGTVYSDRIFRFSHGHIQAVARLPVGLRYVAASKVGPDVLIAGGLATGGATSRILSFDPSTSKVTKLGTLPYPLAHATAGTIGSSMYVIGGRRDDQSATDSVLAITASGRVKTVAHLPMALSDAGVASNASGGLTIVGGTDGTSQLSGIMQLSIETVKVPVRTPSTSPAAASKAVPRGFRGALPGDLMIADRGNNRILIVDPRHHILWHFPKKNGHVRLHFDDDTFFADGGKRIISNEEENHDIIQIAYPSGKLLWRFGHPGVKGSRFGYMNTPDDAYRLDNGLVIVADAYNCRVLEIRGHKVVRSIGKAGHCVHDPPRYLQPVNGDTPLPDGHILVSELNTPYIDEFTLKGRLVRTYQPPVSYPSDPQLTRDGNIILADYTTPGGIVILNRKTGSVMWQYRVPSGPGELDHPSLAAMLPNGNVIVGDDYNHRIVIIDPHTKQIVWHYGHNHVAGTAPGFLDTPDGFDFIPVTPDGSPNPAAIHHGPDPGAATG